MISIIKLLWSRTRGISLQEQIEEVREVRRGKKGKNKSDKKIQRTETSFFFFIGMMLSQILSLEEFSTVAENGRLSQMMVKAACKN